MSVDNAGSDHINTIMMVKLRGICFCMINSFLLGNNSNTLSDYTWYLNWKFLGGFYNLYYFCLFKHGHSKIVV